MSKSENHRNKKVIKRLTEENEEFENYFQSTIIAQLYIDADLLLRKYSPGAIKQFSLKESDLGKPLHELTINLKPIDLEEFIRQTIATNQVVEREVQSTDDKWFRMNIIPFILQKENTTDGVIISFVDINNYVIALKELNKVNSEYETFVYSVSHDLKGPLNNIEGLISTLQDSDKKRTLIESNEILDMLDTSAKKMREMINELSKISREQDPARDNVSKIKLEDVYEEVLLTLKDKIDESHAEIESDFEIKEIAILRKNLRSILYNLISNSIKYRSPDRKSIIKVETKDAGEYILISVKDNGRGIEEDKKKFIFSQFTRAITNVEGTGIGLYLVSKIVDNLCGKIEVDSKVDEGSEFRVFLKK